MLTLLAGFALASVVALALITLVLWAGLRNRAVTQREIMAAHLREPGTSCACWTRLHHGHLPSCPLSDV